MNRILITGRLPQSAIDALSHAHDVDYRETDDPIPRKELLQRVAGKARRARLAFSLLQFHDTVSRWI